VPSIAGCYRQIQYCIDGLIGDRAGTVVQFMWDHDTHTVAASELFQNVGMHTVVLALRARHQISPRWLEMVVNFSLSLSEQALEVMCPH